MYVHNKKVSSVALNSELLGYNVHLVPHYVFSTSVVSTYVAFGLCTRYWGNPALVESLVKSR